MGSDQKTLVILDTNKIRSNLEWERDFSCFETKGDFAKIERFIEENELEGLVFIGLPEIVIEEFINNRCDNFSKHIVNIKTLLDKLANMPHCDISTINLPDDSYNYRSFLRGKIFDYIHERRKYIRLMRLNKKFYARTLGLLIDKAIQKKKPFNESQKGFKDALIWEIILNYKYIYEYFSIFILTDNTKDFDDDLKDEFKKKFSKDLNIGSNTDILLVELENIYGLYIRYPEILKYMKSEYFEEVLIDYLSENYGIEIKNFEVKKILEINETTQNDLDKFELGNEYSISDNDIQNLKKISLEFTNHGEEFICNIIFEESTKEIITLSYDIKS